TGGIEERLSEFFPTVLTADLSGLDETERRVLQLLVDASRRLDPVFLLQANRDNERYRRELARLAGPERDAALAYFDVQAGVYERQHDWRPFVEGVPPRPEGAGFYPPDLTSAELEAFVAAHPDRAAELISLTTIVERRGDELVGVPYSEAYMSWLSRAREELREAASITRDETLRRYLNALVDGLAGDAYRDADMAWMDLAGRIELTFGPYETYEDRLFGYKASFESFVTVVDPTEGARLERLKALLPEMERNLPIPDRHKNRSRGAESPIRVADLVFSSGDARAGIQTIAFNLPNDEEVRELKGSKKVLLRNVMAAKYDAILEPIAGRVLVDEQRGHVSRHAFLDIVLHHELSHGLGPGRITLDGKTAEVREFLLEHYNPVEEAKADVVGMWNLMNLMREDEATDEDLKRLYATYVAGLFRSTRFGTASAHGKGAAVQFRLLQDAGAIEIDVETGRVRAVFGAFPKALGAVARRLLMLQAEGDHEAAGVLLEELGDAPPEMRRLLDGLAGIPIDVRPVYPIAGEGP
ncbi:MAG: hypothetical protein OEQ13_11015, partial [Acidobacteriota bacterium]|nr:hypothetical protein [Acidobacteriota bacterium]